MSGGRKEVGGDVVSSASSPLLFEVSLTIPLKTVLSAMNVSEQMDLLKASMLGRKLDVLFEYHSRVQKRKRVVDASIQIGMHSDFKGLRATLPMFYSVKQKLVQSTESVYNEVGLCHLEVRALSEKLDWYAKTNLALAEQLLHVGSTLSLRGFQRAGDGLSMFGFSRCAGRTGLDGAQEPERTPRNLSCLRTVFSQLRRADLPGAWQVRGAVLDLRDGGDARHALGV